MNIWFTKNLGDAMLANESLTHIKQIFLSKYNKVERTNDMAVFYRHESAGRLHCEVIVYFSPAVAIVAKAVQATPCKKPTVEGLDLIVGSEGAWSDLFP